MFRLLTRKVILLGVLAFSGILSVHLYIKANNTHKVVIPQKSTFYTPGQHDNCKWVIHFSNTITTAEGDSSPVQIGIPEIIKDGYIFGVIQSGPDQSLILAFKLPTKNSEIPPIIFTASYTLKDLPLKTVVFRVFNSGVLRMVLYPTEEECVEATMK
tara:strand:+ start:6748 stop:7218 length:471 start_codon:yes stop_codon:yes gene_type:complete